jgi:hypothetical protein
MVPVSHISASQDRGLHYGRHSMAGWRDPVTRRSLERVLGTDPTAFPTDVLVRAPHWHDGQFELLVEALTARAQGATAKEARAIIAKCRGEEICDWFIRVGQNSGNYRCRVIARSKKVEGVTSVGGVYREGLGDTLHQSSCFN